MEAKELNEVLTKLEKDEEYARFLCETILKRERLIAKNVLKEIIEYAKQRRLNKAYPWLIHTLGWVLYDLTEIEDILPLQEEAYSIFKEQNDTEGMLCTINALLVYYSSHQIYDIAIEWGLKGISMAQADENYERLEVIKANLVHVYFTMKEYEKCKEVLDEIEKMPTRGSKEGQVIRYVNRATCDIKLNQLDEAEEYLKKAQEVAYKYTPDNMCHVIRELGRLEMARGNYDKAEEKFIQAIQVASADGYYLGKNKTLIVWAELESLRGNNKAVIEKLKPLLECESTTHSRVTLKEIYIYLSKAYEGTKDYESANYYLKKQMELHKEASNVASTASLKSLESYKKQAEAETYKFLYNQTQALYGIGQKITSNLSKEDIFKIITKEIRELFNADQVRIATYKEEDKAFEYNIWLEEGHTYQTQMIAINEGSFEGYAIKNQQDLLINNIEKDYIKYFENFEEYLVRMANNKIIVDKQIPQSGIFVPIMRNNQVTGIISVICYKKDSYKLKDLTTLKILSTYTGIALENAKLYKEVQYAAHYDGLTNLLNRREVFKKSKKLYIKAQKNNSSVGIAMIDIDDFKEINDTYGHQVGDQVLACVSTIIKAELDQETIIGRYGGEEFVIILAQKDINQSVQLIEKIRKAVESQIIKCSDGEIIRVTISVGFARVDTPRHSLEYLIGCADKALYEAKDSGKNKVVVC